MTYAPDANIVIQLLRKHTHVVAQFDSTIRKNANIVIPPVVHYAVLRGFLYKPAMGKEKAYNKFCNLHSVGKMTKKMWNQAARIYANLRKKGYTVSDADILIAAFCMANDYTLVTNNIKDYGNIEGLLIENWVN